MNKLRILFICYKNTARSQMAEALARLEGGERVEVFSAGIEPGDLAPEAADLIRSWELDPGQFHSKSLQGFIGQKWDFIITLCDEAAEACPFFPGDAERIHWSIPNPNDPALLPGERKIRFKMAAEELRQRIDLFLQANLKT